MGLLFTSPNLIGKLYNEHLKCINNIHFTAREIDIISCILHNRGDKKIASLFFISHRTVNVHVSNISRKIDGCSKEHIIDFVETSGVMNSFREYYIHILVKAHFEKFLNKIATNYNRNPKQYPVQSNELCTEIFDAVSNHLKMANIKIGDEVDDNTQLIDISSIKWSTYYKDMLCIISSLIKSKDINILINEFMDTHDKIIAGNNLVLNDHIIKKPNQLDKQPIFNPKLRPIITILTALCFVVLFSINLNTRTKQTDKTIILKPNAILALENYLLDMQKQGFSSNNINNSKNKINYSMIKNAEKVLEFKELREVKEYFNKSEMTSELLLSYIYHLHALSSNYLFNHNPKLSREIILYCKTLIENYINSRSPVHINFETVTEEEILVELRQVTHIPEIYTRILYTLGRTYIYERKPEDGIKYFKYAKYLGSTLNLYEAYLSEMRGLLIADKHKFEKLFHENIKTDHQKNLKYLIKSFADHKADSNPYIFDYNPTLKTQKTIIPSQDSFNIFHCDTVIVDLYKDLFELTLGENVLQNLSKELSEFVHTSLVTRHEKENNLDEIPKRKIASFYISLAELFLILHKKNIRSNELENLFERNEIKLPRHENDFNVEDKNLEIARELYFKAKDISKNSDYTKADAYTGLANIYEIYLEKIHNSASKTQYDEVVQMISKYKKEANQINHNLNRS